MSLRDDQLEKAPFSETILLDIIKTVAAFSKPWLLPMKMVLARMKLWHFKGILFVKHRHKDIYFYEENQRKAETCVYSASLKYDLFGIYTHGLKPTHVYGAEMNCIVEKRCFCRDLFSCKFFSWQKVKSKETK